ncbi:uncharacterized protein LOC131884569 [Tigriopus californicus]|uniref:uncharacterized protein LOC131884569 n=1 Tax=Tigriopus californicus TaxID=6832 RepID=UPI0027D9ED52|nr:uncharacterized protein LOC131884569 [Tigriopus californicus]
MKMSDLELIPRESSLSDILSRGTVAELESYLEANPHLVLDAPIADLQGRTLLHEAIRLGQIPMVGLLLERHANPCQKISAHGKTVLHLTAQKCWSQVLKLLLQNLGPHQFRINDQDNSQSKKTPLHFVLHKLLRQKDNEEARSCLNSLLTFDGIDVNIVDANEVSPLEMAIDIDEQWIIEEMIHLDANLDHISRTHQKSLREILTERFPNLILRQESDANPNIWYCLETGEEDAIVEEIERLAAQNKNFDFDSDNGTFSLLQFACLNQLEKVVKELLKAGASPNQTVIGGFAYPPCFIVAQRRNLRLLSILKDHPGTDFGRIIKKDNKRINVLHYMLHSDFNYRDSVSRREQPKDMAMISNTLTTLEMILGDRHLLGENRYDFLVNDPMEPCGNTPLHLASRFPVQSVAHALLLQYGAHRSLFKVNQMGWDPIQKLTTSTVKAYLDNCISWQEHPLQDDFHVSLDHEALVPKRKFYPFKGIELVDQGQLEDSCLPYYYVQEGHQVTELEFVCRLADLHMDLCDHPIISSFVSSKWDHFQKFRSLRWGMISFRSLLTVSSILYCFVTFGGKSMVGSTECLKAASLNASEEKFNPANCSLIEISELFRYVLLSFWGVAGLYVVFRISLQMTIDLRSCLANLKFLFRLMDFWVLVLLVICIPFIALSPPHEEVIFSFSQARDLSGMILVLCGVDLSLLLRDHWLHDRELVSKLYWTEVVAKDMFKFLSLHLFLIGGFIAAFYLQLHDDTMGFGESEHNSFTSQTIITKIMAMIIGELEYGDFPFTSLVFNYITFGLFVFIVVIVMMNLLTGFAVLDVQDLTNQSNDKMWKNLASQMTTWEQGVIQLTQMFPSARRWLANIASLRPGEILVIYPNNPTPYLKTNEILIKDESVANAAKMHCQKQIEKLEETLLLDQQPQN